MKVYTTKTLIRELQQNGYEILTKAGKHCKLRHKFSGRIVVVPTHKGDIWPGLTQTILTREITEPTPRRRH